MEPPRGPFTRSRRLPQALANASIQIQPTAEVTVSKAGLIKLKKTVPRDTESFGGKLEWKRHYSEVPMTSTPIQKQKVQRNLKTPLIPIDLNSMDSEHSIISPIQKRGRREHGLQRLTRQKDQNQNASLSVSEEPKVPEPMASGSKVCNEEVVTSSKPTHGFDFLLYKYGKRTKGADELQVHFELHEAKTYKPVSHKDVQPMVRFLEVNEDEEEAAEKKGTKKKAPAKGSRGKGKKEKLPPTTIDWIKRTNKEFEDVMNFDLCVQAKKSVP